ncbi:MAG: SRPBCC family protein [Mycobacterium sp.]|uniref:SRPBCC family protein n=1 Tax=Mycobacterium sp. TaxID=1785 RepID=UPI003C68605E
MATRTAGFAPPLNQIAFSVVDLRLIDRWFREGFGLLPSGGSRALMRGRLAANVQGLPRAASTCWWLLGRNSWFQLELFQFERPIATLMPADFRPCDIGYTRIGIWVEDFDATMKKLAGLGSQPLADPMGERGGRHACVRNPDGVYVEIMEDDPLPQLNQRGRIDCPAAIRSVTLSVPQLSDVAAFFEEGIGLKASTATLHTPEHEALWGLAGATTKSRLFDAGEVLIEVVQYLDPVGKPRPHDYRLSDQGILNIAFGARRKADFNAVYRHAEAFGAQPNCRPVHLPATGSVVYVNDPHGFSVEILRTKPGLADRIFGFKPRPVGKRPDPDTRRIDHRIIISAPADKVWDAITDQDNMARWIGFDPVVVRKEGWTQRHGAGTERLMQGPRGVGQVVEQVLATTPLQHLRYRVIEGSPLSNHQGEVTLKQSGAQTELVWSIRFRPKVAGTGALLQKVLQARLRTMLNEHLKPYLESASAETAVK